MRGLGVLSILVVVLVATPFASVFAQGYAATNNLLFSVPILGTSGSPALTGNQFTGLLTTLYADGSPVFLASNKVSLQLCASSCTTQDVVLKQTAPGSYAYSFTPPSSLTGTITITVVAGSLADDNGRQFPSVNTQIGAYATPGLTSSAASPTAPAGQPVQPQSNPQPTVEQAPALPRQGQSPLVLVLSALIVLVAAGALLIRRR